MTSHTNRLIHEKSPYLLQHAHNPVDWFPWGQEAFDLAKKEDKPIFLSIGYATCHWCHVMEKESFEDAETAHLMNDAFVNIKVDREELPEVDSLYMEFAQVLMSSAGGWPLNLILTSDLKPFFAVTYLPPKTKRGLMGLQQFIQHIKLLWHSEEREKLLEQANRLLQVFQKNVSSAGQLLPSEKQISQCVEILFELADPVYGGFKGEPKFPFGYQACFLLEYCQAKADSRSLFYLELTLENMFRGGIYDHLGGGFSRYSIDEKWQIPHFEKMLYDNAILARTYLDVWKFTKNPIYQRICEETLSYVLRDLLQPCGAFSSAEDADSNGKEGAYYVWDLQEILEALPQDQATLFCQLYNVTHEGNFDGKNILHLSKSFEEFAEERNEDWREMMPKIEWARQALLKKRALRPQPFKDDKVITSWNALMIDALVKAGRIWDKSNYIQAALTDARFIRSNLWKEGKLLRRWREGEGRFFGCLDDYAFMIKACLSLFEEDCGTEWLSWAIEMTGVLEAQFKMPNGAFYFSEANESLILRRCDFYDGSEPSGNAVHSENLIRLFQITGQESFLSQAEDIFKSAKQHMDTYPPGACYMLMSLARYLDLKTATIVVALNESQEWKQDIQKVLQSVYKPHLQVIWLRQDDEALMALAPFLSNKRTVDNRTTVHICYQDRCEPPLHSLPEILQAIRDL